MIDLQVLASGSRGNASLLHFSNSHRLAMIDAGLSPRRTRHALAARGLPHTALTDVLLTHADRDHLHAGWAKALPSWSCTFHVHASHVGRMRHAGIDMSRLAVFEEDVALGEAIQVRTHVVPHDDSGTIAFAIQHQEACLAWATDVGQVTHDLRTFLAQSAPSVLGIESNYDPHLQKTSGRPHFLIDRITGGSGHLSNEEAMSTAVWVHENSPLAQIVLLHRSMECNCPQLMTELWQQSAAHLVDRVMIASQDQACERISIMPGRCPI